MQIEIVGRDALVATKALLNLEGIEGSYEVIDEIERGKKEIFEVIATVGLVTGIAADTITVSESLHQWYQDFQQPSSERIEKVIIVAPNGKRLLLEGATVEQIQELWED